MNKNYKDLELTLPNLQSLMTNTIQFDWTEGLHLKKCRILVHLNKSNTLTQRGCPCRGFSKNELTNNLGLYAVKGMTQLLLQHHPTLSCKPLCGKSNTIENDRAHWWYNEFLISTSHPDKKDCQSVLHMIRLHIHRF